MASRLFLLSVITQLALSANVTVSALTLDPTTLTAMNLANRCETQSGESNQNKTATLSNALGLGYQLESGTLNTDAEYRGDRNHPTLHIRKTINLVLTHSSNPDLPRKRLHIVVRSQGNVDRTTRTHELVHCSLIE